jgi:hypothetical protein
MITIDTPRRRWIEDKERSNADRVSLIWIDADSGDWVRLPISRSLIGETEFNLGLFLDDQADRAIEARTA